MPFIVSRSIENDALKKLESFDEVIIFSADGVTYPEISSHPDIFFCSIPDSMIISRAVPVSIIKKLDQSNVNYRISDTIPGKTYPQSAAFNAVVTGKYIFHRLDITGNLIKSNTQHLQQVNVKQAYTRCNLLPLDEFMITSDNGILAQLKRNGIESIYVDPAPVKLKGFKHGFFGGCCGVFGNNILINGSLKSLAEHDIIYYSACKYGYIIIELTSRPLTDIGSILWIDSKK